MVMKWALKEHSTTTLVPSPNPLAKTLNMFTPLQYHNVIIGPNKLVNYQNPYEDQYLEKDELLPIIVLEKDQAKVNPIHTGTNPCFNKNPSPNHFYLNITLIMIIWMLDTMDSFLVYLVHKWNIVKVPKMWFIDFGPIPTIFPLEIEETYNFFGEKLSFVPGYRLISFVASQAITWIMALEYTTIQQYETIDIKTLCHQTKVKWWKKFNNNLISKSDEWVNNNSKSTSQQNTSPLKKQKEENEASFLLEKQKIMAKLASATSVEEFEATFLKARSILDSDSANHSDVESSESNRYLHNGDMFD
ncbi:hypothetical protein CR513_61563, partial [Mucuna pruriens]